MNRDFWRGRKVLVTGHTGFKGAWLAQWLRQLGADVCGMALHPHTTPSLHDLLGEAAHLNTRIGDIRDAGLTRAILRDFDPDIIFHLAAQALVRPSYQDPVATYHTNVIGTLNVLEAIRALGPDRPRAVVAVTTDKVYENRHQGRRFREDDPLGGKDPYSNSKACCELAVASWRDCFAEAARMHIATARAGNVIGGGDWAADRLVPDVVRALDRNEPVVLRYPQATRPWQHVLEPLRGYLMMAERLITMPETCSKTLNFGPDEKDSLAVSAVVDHLTAAFGGRPGWVQDQGHNPPEAQELALDSSLAGDALGWFPRFRREDTIGWTADWYRRWRDGADARAMTADQIDHYMTLG